MKKYDEWKDKYYDQEVVDLNKYFSEKDFELIGKLGIIVLEKVYTESEFENLYSNILKFYKENELEQKKLLDNVGVTTEEYNEFLKKIKKVSEVFNF